MHRISDKSLSNSIMKLRNSLEKRTLDISADINLNNKKRLMNISFSSNSSSNESSELYYDTGKSKRTKRDNKK
jgi:hypothetical protein